MIENFKPTDAFQDGLRWWWLIVVLMVGGAAGGWASWSFMTPIFESYASISVMIDFTRTGQLTDIEEDLAMVAVGDIIKSTQVQQDVIRQGVEKGLVISEEKLKENTFLERQNELWLLRVRDENPQNSAILANLWVDASYSALKEAYSHALNGDTLLKYMDSLANCLEQMAATEPVQVECGTANLEQLLIEMKKTNSEAQKEKLASLGIMPASLFSISERALPATTPVRFGRGQIMFGGALIGFLFAILAIQWDLPARLIKRK
jgi:hypothetical protein